LPYSEDYAPWRYDQLDAPLASSPKALARSCSRCPRRLSLKAVAEGLQVN